MENIEYLRNELKKKEYEIKKYELKEICNKFRHQYVELPDESFDIIYNLYVKNIKGTPKTALEHLYFAVYSSSKEKNRINFQRYLEEAVRIGQVDAINKYVKFRFF